MYDDRIILSNIDGQFPLKKLKLQSEVEVEYFDQNGCQTFQYFYNENTNTNMTVKKVNVESF